MANNCDDAFQKKQRLEQMRRAIDDELARMDAGEQLAGDQGLAVFFRDRTTGEEVPVNFDRWFKEAAAAHSDSMQDFAARAVGERRLPAGDQGWFTNAAQLVDRIGVDNAEQMVALLQSFTASWQRSNPADFARVTAVNDREAFAQRLADGFRDAGYALDNDLLTQAVIRNVAPFQMILDNQTKLQVLADMTRVNLSSKLRLVMKTISETGLALTDRTIKQEFVDSYRKAVFANRSAALSRRVSGQLLQQLQRDPGMDIAGLSGRLSEDLVAQAERIFGDTNIVVEDSLVGKVAEASSRGVDGLQDLADILDTMDEELLDPLAPPVDEGFKFNWQRNARVYYKDSQLFSGNTQVVNNYLSGKLIFAAEGVRKAAENGVTLRMQDVTQPIGTKWHRHLLSTDKTLLGARVAAEAGILAHDAVRQGWKASIKQHFLEADTPFAGNPDTLGTKGTENIAEQYDKALRVLYGENVDETGKATMRRMYEGVDDEGLPVSEMTGANDPSLGNAFGSLGQVPPQYWPLAIRDKAFVGMKLLVNHIVEKTTGTKLPVTSALQMMGAVDHRAGMRVFMTTRANQLLLDRIKFKPNESWADRRAWVREKLDDEIYQATPTPQNIRDARKQFMLDDASDEEVATFLAAGKIGTPVQVLPDQRDAFQFSAYARLQNEPKGIAGIVDEFAMKIRKEPYVDALFPYWRSPFNQQLWTLKGAFPPIIQTGRLIFKKEQPTTEEVAKVAGGWITSLTMFGLFHALDNQGVIEGNGPLDPEAKKQWLAAGHIPNSMFGIPLLSLGALPVLQTLFLYKDLKESFNSGQYSDYDRYGAHMGIAQVLTGQLMRQTSLGQLAQLTELLLEPSRARAKALAFAGYLANGQLNPASGVMRDIERFGNLRQASLYPPRSETKRDQELQDAVDPNDPLEGVRDGLRNFAYYMSPLTSAVMGRPIKETDYLGYELRTPEGVFRREWQEKMGVGTPGVWPSWAPVSRNSRSPVHAVLDRIGMLVPPSPLLSGRMNNVLMGEDLEKEYNAELGTVKGAAIGDDPVMGNLLSWRRTAKAASMEEGRRVVESTPYSIDLNKDGFMDRLTRDRTLEQSLRALFSSPTWKRLEADPAFTTDLSITDRPKREVKQLPGPKMVMLLHDYYDALAQRKIEVSNSPAAAQWRKRRDAAIAAENEQDVEALVNRGEQMFAP
jgi:hypothetical protein